APSRSTRICTATTPTVPARSVCATTRPSAATTRGMPITAVAITATVIAVAARMPETTETTERATTGKETRAARTSASRVRYPSVAEHFQVRPDAPGVGADIALAHP